jgi:hypothetical protein
MWIALAYVVGVMIGLVAIDGGPGARLGLALAWPLGPLAFIVTVAGLLVVAAVAFPWFGLVLAAAAGAAWWAFG